MDQKPDSRKRPLCQLDDGSLICPDCEDLTEHRSKHCSKQIFTQTTVSSNTVDADTDKDDTEKRQCYRCDNCHLSFTDSQNLKDHLKKNCLKMPVVDPNQAKSYESCMNTLTSVLYNEECYFGSLKKARRQTSNALKRYSLAEKRKVYAHKTYMEAVAREQTLCTIVSAEEQQILSHLTSQYLQTFNVAMEELEIAGQAVNNALHQLKNHKHIAMFASTKVDFAYSDVIKAFGELRFDANLSPEARDQELKKIGDVLKQRHHIYTELQDGVSELETSVSIILGIEINKEEPKSTKNESGMDPAPRTFGNESGKDAAPAATGSESGTDAAPAATGSESGTDAAPAASGSESGTDAAPAASGSESGTDSAASGSESGTDSAPAASGNESGTDAAPAASGNESGTDAAPAASGNESGMDAAINSMKESIDVAQPNQMDETLENLDDPKSSTSGTYLG